MEKLFFLTPQFVFDEQRNEKVLYWLCYKNVEQSPFRVVGNAEGNLFTFLQEKFSFNFNSNNNISNNRGNVTIGGKRQPNIKQTSFGFGNTQSVKNIPQIKINELVIDASMAKVEIKNNRIYIDGSEVSTGNMIIVEKVLVRGNSNLISTDNSAVTVNGDVVEVKSNNGRVTVSGNVTGNIKTENGRVDVKGTSGDVFVTNGSAKSESTKKKADEPKTPEPEQTGTDATAEDILKQVEEVLKKPKPRKIKA